LSWGEIILVPILKTFGIEEFKRKYPNLARELGLLSKEEELLSRIERGYSPTDEPKSLRGYVPDVIDFIRRCETEEEAFEIIDFLEKRGEISQKIAELIKRKIKEKGLRFFGPKKPVDYYQHYLDRKFFET